MLVREVKPQTQGRQSPGCLVRRLLQQVFRAICQINVNTGRSMPQRQDLMCHLGVAPRQCLISCTQKVSTHFLPAKHVLQQPHKVQHHHT